jgi:hypothetical protein
MVYGSTDFPFVTLLNFVGTQISRFIFADPVPNSEFKPFKF